MDIKSYLCLGGVEIGNQARTAVYLENLGITGAMVSMPIDCACIALDDGFSNPSSDPAPWYEPTRPESDDFLGFWPTDATFVDPLTRQVNQHGLSGSVIGPETAKGRILQVTGNLLARTPLAMQYGKRWLQEALRGSLCSRGGVSDDLIVLLTCPEGDEDPDTFYRTLVKSALVSGPVFTQLSALPQYSVLAASFVLVSSHPYLYLQPVRAIDELDLSVERNASLTTPTWMGEGTFSFSLTNGGTTTSTDILITGQISLDGDCPITGSGLSVPLTFSYLIPSLAPEDTLVIDGARRQVSLIDASSKSAFPGYPSIDFEGPFLWPDVGACTTMCVSVSGGNSDTVLTVDTYLMEL